MNILLQINTFKNLCSKKIFKLPKESKKGGLFAYLLVFKDCKILMRGEDAIAAEQLMASLQSRRHEPHLGLRRQQSTGAPLGKHLTAGRGLTASPTK